MSLQNISNSYKPDPEHFIFISFKHYQFEYFS